MLFRKRIVVGSLAGAIVFLLGVALAAGLYSSRLAAPLEEANAALLRGDWEQARSGYQRSRGELEDSPWLRRLLAADYHDALIGEAEVLYVSGQYEEALAVLNQEAERSVEFSQDPRRLLWTGNLWFRRAIEEEEEAERRDQLNAAVDFYRRGLEVSPDQWELKFNYELACLVLAQEAPAQLNEREEQQRKRRLLPRIRTDQQRQRRVLPPEERG